MQAIERSQVAKICPDAETICLRSVVSETLSPAVANLVQDLGANGRCHVNPNYPPRAERWMDVSYTSPQSSRENIVAWPAMEMFGLKALE